MQIAEDFESLIITSFTCEQDQSINYSSSPADATHFPPLKMNCGCIFRWDCYSTVRTTLKNALSSPIIPPKRSPCMMKNTSVIFSSSIDHWSTVLSNTKYIVCYLLHSCAQQYLGLQSFKTQNELILFSLKTY